MVFVTTFHRFDMDYVIQYIICKFIITPLIQPNVLVVFYCVQDIKLSNSAKTCFDKIVYKKNHKYGHRC